MSNNILYKALAAVSTVGIVVIAGIQVTTALKKGNTAEDQLSKTMVEIKKARKDALAEVKSIRSEVLKELNGIKSNTLSEIKADRANALGEVKAAKKDALASIQSTAGNKTSKVWLVLKWGGWNFANTSGIEKIEMSDMNQCELMGAQWMASPRAFPERYNFEKMAYVCIES